MLQQVVDLLYLLLEADTNINLNLTPKGSGVVMIDGNVGIDSGKIDLKNGGTASQILFYCESSNAHAQTLIVVHLILITSATNNSYIYRALTGRCSFSINCFNCNTYK